MIPVIIPYFKNRDQLDKCMRHLLQAGEPFIIEIFVRDNSEDNIYFTAAINEGIRKYLAEPDWKYILIINQDMYLQSDALSEMVKFMDSHPKCGIGMPMQLDDSNNNFASFAGGVEAFPEGTTLFGSAQLFWANAEITWASGGCMILRRDMIREIGLLDENFRFIGSDSDYCFTARSRGWQVWRIGKAKGVHEEGQARTPSSKSLTLIKTKDMLFFAKKWLSGDLYRGLADEHENTGTEKIENEISRLQKQKTDLERELANVES